MSDAPAYVYEGAVVHRRLKPARHDLRYRVFSFLFDLDRLDETAAGLKLFSRNRFNLFAFHDGDHGALRPSDIARYIRDALDKAGIDSDGRILLLCYPRMLGYAFNPLSVYYCYDREDRLAAMIYEVSNTFGDKHAYLIPVETGVRRIEQSAEKVFHVSPFIGMNMRYHFSLSEPAAQVGVSIRTSDADGLLLTASFQGERSALTDRKLLSLFWRYPLMTVKVIVGIHVEALKLFIKGVSLHPGAPAPDYPITVVSPEAMSEAA